MTNTPKGEKVKIKSSHPTETEVVRAESSFKSSVLNKYHFKH